MIIGEGYERPRLEALRDELGADRLGAACPGRVDDDELVAWYRRAWVVASSSQREGWGMTLTEAAACGTPAVATDIAGHADAVLDGESGLLVDDVDDLAGALGRVLGDEVLRSRLSKGALDRARWFTWDATARRALEALAGEEAHPSPEPALPRIQRVLQPVHESHLRGTAARAALRIRLYRSVARPMLALATDCAQRFVHDHLGRGCAAARLASTLPRPGAPATASAVDADDGGGARAADVPGFGPSWPPAQRLGAPAGRGPRSRASASSRTTPSQIRLPAWTKDAGPVGAGQVVVHVWPCTTLRQPATMKATPPMPARARAHGTGARAPPDAGHDEAGQRRRDQQRRRRRWPRR